MVALPSDFSRKHGLFRRKPMFLNRFVAWIAIFCDRSDWKGFTESD
jgi:hypothetical protein